MRNSTPGPGRPHDRRRCAVDPSPIVVGRRKVSDRPGRLGEPVDLEELAAEQRDARRQHLLADRRGAVDDHFERREVGIGHSGDELDELQHGRDDERMGHPARREQADELAEVDLPQNLQAGADVVGDGGPSTATDVEQRHRHEDHRVGRHVPHLAADREQSDEVVVGEHHPLGAAGRPAGIQLLGDVVRRRRGLRIVVGLGGDPVFVGAVDGMSADDQDQRIVFQVAAHRIEDRNEVRADDEHLGRRVVDDEGHLGWRQPPVDVDAHGVAEGRPVAAARSARCRSCRAGRPGPATRRLPPAGRSRPVVPARTVRST